MASITVFDEANTNQGVDPFDADKLLPPNLVWRFALAVQHKQIRISTTKSSGQSAIAVSCPLQECSSLHNICYIDLQRVLYHHLSDIKNNCIDHLGTFCVYSNKLLLEVHFTSSEQIKRCIDELDKMAISTMLTKTFQSFVESFHEIELEVTLVIQSNLESRLRLVTRENAEYAFSIVYTNKPAVAIFHIQNPEIYGPVKEAYSQLLAKFPDFLGETGAIDFSGIEKSNSQPEVGEISRVSHTSYPILNPFSNKGPNGKETSCVKQSAKDIVSVTNASSTSQISSTDDNDSPISSMEKQSQSGITPQEQMPNCTKERSDNDNSGSMHVKNGEKSFLDEPLSEDVIGRIAAGIPPHLYKFLGNRLGLDGNTIARIEYDSRQNSLNFILGILSQANKQHDACRRTFITALLHCNLQKQAKILDDSLVIPPIGEEPLVISSSPAESLFLVDVDGHLYFYDQKVESHNQQPITFWKRFQREIQSAINEALRYYGVNIHSTSVGSLTAHIKLKSYKQAMMIYADIDNGKLKDIVEVEIKALGFSGVLAITFKIGGVVVVNSKHCYEVYVESLLKKKPHLLPVISLDMKRLQHFQQKKAHITTVQKQIKTVEHQKHGTTTEKDIGMQQHMVDGTSADKMVKCTHDTDTNMGNETRRVTTQADSKAHTASEFDKDTDTLSSAGIKPDNVVSITDAITHGTLEQLQIAIEGGTSLTEYHNGFLPLHIAAHHGKSEMIKSLVAHGADIEIHTATEEKITALHLAAYAGHLKAVQTLVELGANIEATSSKESTPLHLSACQRNILVTNFLLEMGANCNAASKQRKTPLFEAVTRGHQGNVKVLLHHGADMTLATVDGETPIHHAVVMGDAEMLKLIVTANPQVLNHATIGTYEHPLITAVKLQKVPLVKVILDTKADPNICNKDGMSPLAVASCLENLEIMELLVKRGAEIKLSFPPHGTPLHIVAVEGKANAARKLLKMCMDPNVLDSEGTTPLRRAVENKQIEVASVLLKHGANIHIECPGDELSLLHKAAKRNDVKMLELLLKNGADPYETGVKGGTAMFTAAASGSCDAIDLLSQYSELINIPNKGTFTPLMAAIYRRKYDCALQLLKHMPDVSLRNLDNMTVLYICIDFRAPEEVVQAILLCDATINDPGPNGVSPLLLACHRGFTELVVTMLDKNKGFLKRHPELSPTLVFEAIDAGSCGTLEALLQHGSNPNCIHPHMPMTPLHRLCHQQTATERMLQIVLDHNPDMNIVTEMGAPLHVAVVTKKNTFVAMLLKNKANPNITSGPEKVTPLITAAEVDNVEAARLILEYGGRVNHALATNGYTALHKAASSNFTEMAQFLIKAMVNGDGTIDRPSTEGYTALHLAVSAGSQEVFAVLIENNSNMNAQDNEGRTPLMHAIYKEKNDVALMLLELGADVHVGGIDGVCALHIAARVGALDIITRILDLRGNPDIQEGNGVTPLFLAILMGQIAAAKILIERKASVDLANIQHDTPLHVAAQTNNSEAVRLLLQHGANPTARDMKGKIPKDVTDSKNLEKLLDTAAKKRAERESLIVKEVEYNLPGEGTVVPIAAGHIRSKQQWQDIQNRRMHTKEEQK